MTALAFTVGMLFGLCLNLPGVSSPLSDEASVHGHRAPRHVRADRALPESVAGTEHQAVPGRIHGPVNPSDSRAYIAKSNLKGTKAKQLMKNASDSYRTPSTIRAKVKAIEDTYDSIKALKEQQVRGKVSDINLGVGSDSAQPNHRVRLDTRHFSGGGVDAHRILPQSGSEASDQGSHEEARHPKGRVFGHRSVTVRVGGGRTDQRTDRAPGGDLDQGAVQPSDRIRPDNSNVSPGDQEGNRLEEQGRDWHQGKDYTQEHFHHLEDIIDGVFWTPKIEMFIPPGFSQDQVNTWRKKLEENKVVGMSEGCGRMQNRRLILLDATPACARYRINTDQMQGEVFSYYLGRVLGIRNIPPTVLASASPASDPRWTDVDRQVALAQWNPSKPVVITPWLDGLRPVFIPRELRSPADRDDTGNINVHTNLHPSAGILRNRTLQDLRELVQWSDLIIFDYLTANVDRVVNNMFNQQWNSEMMQNPTHNLEQSKKDGVLVFLDNESGLFHSYRLLDKYSQYHERLLGALCIFRRHTVDILRRLHKEGSVGEELMKLYRQEEPLHWMLPGLPHGNAKVLKERVGNVVAQISRCESRYSQ